MRKINLILVIILLVIMAGCERLGNQSTDNLIIVDVTKKYPQKELILQDILDVEYIPIDLIYDKQEKILFEYAVYNDDFSPKDR